MPDDNPFDSIESAQEYLRLLESEVESVRSDIAQDTEEAVRNRAERRLDALHIVDYKLKQLSEKLVGSLRILNDLRMLQRLLVVDDVPVATASSEGDDSRETR